VEDDEKEFESKESVVFILMLVPGKAGLEANIKSWTFLFGGLYTVEWGEWKS
jgi:hypothetical protein